MSTEYIYYFKMSMKKYKDAANEGKEPFQPNEKQCKIVTFSDHCTNIGMSVFSS